jgi:ABC-type nitrate/sulfonate/bicarbonate transport system permease component
MTGALLASVRRRPRVKPVLGRIATLAALPLALIVVWAILDVVADSSVIAGPIEAARQIVETLGFHRYRASLVATTQTVLVAFGLAVVTGGAAGFALGLAPFWFRVLGPIVHGIYSIPKVTVFPLFLVFLGFGVVSRGSFAFLHGFFPMVVILMAATANLRMTDIYLKLAASLNMSFAQLVRTILLPAALPSFLTAMRLAFGLTFLGTIVAEMFAGHGGLGDELVRNMHLVRVDRILAQIVIIGAMALIPNAILRTLEVWVTRRTGLST